MDSITFNPREVSAYYAVRIPHLKQSRAAEWRGPCPVHHGKDDNFAVNAATGKAFCQSQCGCGWDILALEMELTGADFKTAKAEVFQLVGRPNSRNGNHPPRARIVDTYHYVDEAGKLLYQAVRMEPKRFWQRRPNGRGGWIKDLKGVRLVLYRLPELLKRGSEIIYICEGEKDVETLESLGLLATCNPMGAGKWRPEYSESIRGRSVVILLDNDAPGRKHAAAEAADVLRVACEVRVVQVPTGKDVSDWMAAGGTLSRLRELTEAAAPMDAAALSELRRRWELADEEPRHHQSSPAQGADDWPKPEGAAMRAVLAKPDLPSYGFHDSGNADRLIALHGKGILFCHALKKWLVWDGKRWAVDEVGHARKLAKETMLEFLRQAVEARNEHAEKFAKQSLDARLISRLLSMAECEIFVEPDKLDTHPSLLNFMSGTVDLRTGEIRAHDPADRITKLIHYDYRPGAPCPRWLAFLDQIMGGGPDASEAELERAQRLTEYLQRALGYSLTGSTIEKAVFIPFGEGDNGKSTLLSTFRQLAEEYSVLLQADTLMARQESNNTQADLADLRGARYVQTSETEEGQRLAQGKLKRITQGMGKIKAVRKYENPIEFSETHKLWMDTNRKPTIRDADDKATFSRLHPIPFTVRIPKDRIDRELPAKLLQEAEGILAWAVDGAIKWHKCGLMKPPEVEAANNQWRAEVDQLGRFIEDRCVVAEGVSAPASSLYAEYKRWAEAGGEQKTSMSSTAFGTRLTARGFEKMRTTHGIKYCGIGIQAAQGAEA